MRIFVLGLLRLSLWLCCGLIVCDAAPSQEPGTAEVLIDGTAVETAAGPAILQPSGCVIFIDGLAFWPPGFYRWGTDGIRVVAKGRLVERYDLPVFEEKPDSPKREGIPVPPGTDLKEASRRYLLYQAVWDEWRISTDPFRNLQVVTFHCDGDQGVELAPAARPNCLLVLQIPRTTHERRLKAVVKGLNEKGYPYIKVEFQDLAKP